MTNWQKPAKTGEKAGRLRLQPWRDPRLLLGLMLVLGATVLGARVAAGTDDTVEYWAVRGEIVPGEQVEAHDLHVVRVKLPADTGARYLRADEEFDAQLNDMVWARHLAPGSLLVRDALIDANRQSFGELPLNVAAGSAPDDLARGDRVDVWVGPAPGEQGDAKTAKLLTSVRVVQSGRGSDLTDGGLSRTVVVDVDHHKLDDAVVGSVSSGRVTLVRVS